MCATTSNRLILFQKERVQPVFLAHNIVNHVPELAPPGGSSGFY